MTFVSQDSASFLQYKGEIRVKNTQNQGPKEVKKQFLLFASVFMLEQLEQKARFIDAAFSIVPHPFTQLLAILVYNATVRKYVPALYVLCEIKIETLYHAIFTALQSVCKGYGITIFPSHIMPDFEKRLRCHFHSAQAFKSHGLLLPLLSAPLALV